MTALNRRSFQAGGNLSERLGAFATPRCTNRRAASPTQHRNRFGFWKLLPAPISLARAPDIRTYVPSRLSAIAHLRNVKSSAAINGAAG